MKTFDVTLHITAVQTYEVKANNEEDAILFAEDEARGNISHVTNVDVMEVKPID